LKQAFPPSGSASWCAPCKSFTPKLIQFYSKLAIADGKNFEVAPHLGTRHPNPQPPTPKKSKSVEVNGAGTKSPTFTRFIVNVHPFSTSTFTHSKRQRSPVFIFVVVTFFAHSSASVAFRQMDVAA
jgi:thiol-disulfide isomerase/thioredoxin